MNIKSRLLFVFATSLIFLTFPSCTKTEGSGGDGDLTGGGETTNGLGNSYPVGLAIESPYSSGNAVEGLLKTRTQTINNPTPETDISFQTFKDRQDEIVTRLNGASAEACGVTLGLFKKSLETKCYGPAVSYTNHPQDNTSGNLPSGDLGIWREYETDASGNTPCVIAKLQSLLSDVKGQADTAIDLFSSMLCFAKVKGKETLPALGETLDLATDLNQGFTDINIPAVVTSASLAREEDSASGDAQFLSSLDMVITGPLGKSVSVSLKLKHIAQSTNHSAFKGRMWFLYSGNGVEQMGGNCGGSSEVAAGAITYEKTVDELNYQLRKARYCDKTKAEPFDDVGQLVAENTFDPANGKGWADGFFDIRSRIKLADVTGSIGVTWQAGKNDAKARTFVADIGITSSEKTGCGYFGFGPNVSSENLGAIEGMICNWAGPNGYIQQPSEEARLLQFQTDQVQRQCVTYDTAASKWLSEASTLDIDFGPNNDCNWLSGLGGDLEDNASDAIPPRTNIIKDLFDASASDLKIPAAPTL